MGNKMEDDLNLFMEEARKSIREIYEEALRIVVELKRKKEIQLNNTFIQWILILINPLLIIDNLAYLV